MTKDEIKNRISMALKDPILQQGFEIICKNLDELEKENAELKNQLEMCNKVYNDNLDYSHHIEESLTKAKDMGVRKPCKQAFLAGLKAGRPKWHKVADGDLPKRVDDYVTNIGVLTYDSYGNGVYKWHTPYCEACDYAEEVDGNEVIAWCEIPKYTEK